MESLLSPNKSKGICTRYPVHIETQGNHICGELVISVFTRFKEDEPLSKIVQERNNYFNARKNYEEERNKRIALEKVNKKLRDKLRKI
jgi:hypothetical protein